MAVVPLHGIEGGQCTCGISDCRQPGRHPRTSAGIQDATTDSDKIESYWAEWPKARIGVAVGNKSRVLAVVVEGTAGRNSLRKLRKQNRSLKKTVTIRDGDRRVRLFRVPEGFKIQHQQFDVGVTILGDGDLLKMPSRGGTKNGKCRFVEGRAFGQIPLADAPKWLREHIRERTPRVVKASEISIEDVLISEDHRPLDLEAVAVIAASMKMIGQQTAIRVRAAPGQDGKAILVGGWRRIEAAKSLGWGTIRAEFIDGDEVLAELCEIADDLHRSDLTALEKAEKLAKWVRLTTEREPISRQKVAKFGPGRPEGVIARAARELPIKGKTLQARRKRLERSIKIDAMSADAKAAAIEAGLDTSPSALHEISKEQTTEAQLEKIAEIVKRKAKQRAKRNRVKKSKAKADAPEEKAPPPKHPDDVIFAELRSQTSADLRRTWAKARTKVRRRYLREVLHWEGGKPTSKSD